MADSATHPDLFEALADMEELARLRADRRRAGHAFGRAIGLSDAELAAAFETIAQHVGEGLTLTASACLARVTRRTLAAWVKLADDRRQPWGTFLDALLRRNAEARRQVLADLRKLAEVDARAFRDLTREMGKPSPLEYELSGLRRERTAAFDALTVPTDRERNEGSSCPTDRQSAGGIDKPSEKLGVESRDVDEPSYGGES